MKKLSRVIWARNMRHRLIGLRIKQLVAHLRRVRKNAKMKNAHFITLLFLNLSHNFVKTADLSTGNCSIKEILLGIGFTKEIRTT